MWMRINRFQLRDGEGEALQGPYICHNGQPENIGRQVRMQGAALLLLSQPVMGFGLRSTALCLSIVADNNINNVCLLQAECGVGTCEWCFSQL